MASNPTVLEMAVRTLNTFTIIQYMNPPLVISPLCPHDMNASWFIPRDIVYPIDPPPELFPL